MDYQDTPISAWGYFWYQILFAIPVLGFICAVILAITAQNKNVKNFARAQFCWLVILIIVCFLFRASLVSPLNYLF